MSNNFIEKTLEFFSKSDLCLRRRDVVSVHISDDGKLNLSFMVSSLYSMTEINDNKSLVYLSIFSILDAALDQQIFNETGCEWDSIEGINFKEKYIKLCQIADDDFGIIRAEVYRILAGIRNSIVHRQSKISISDTESIFECGAASVRLSMLALITLSTVAIMIIKSNGIYSERLSGLLRYYFNEIQLGIIYFSDKYSNRRLKISGEVKLIADRRYEVANSKFFIERDGFISVESVRVKLGQSGVFGIDYQINHDGMEYLIPEEAMIDMKIHEKFIHNWIV